MFGKTSLAYSSISLFNFLHILQSIALADCQQQANSLMALPFVHLLILLQYGLADALYTFLEMSDVLKTQAGTIFCRSYY